MEIVEVDLDPDYNIDPEFLENNLFIQDGNLGAYCKTRAFLNVNLLPNYFVYLKTQLEPEEKSCINEYTLQNLLVELAVIKLLYNTLPLLTDYVLAEIRGAGQYWIQNSRVQQRIDAGERKVRWKTQEIEKVETYRQYSQETARVRQGFQVQLREEEGQKEQTESPVEEEWYVDRLENVVEEGNKRLTRGQVSKQAQLSQEQPERVKSLLHKRIRKARHASQQSLFLNVDQQKRNPLLPIQLLPYLQSYLVRDLPTRSAKERFRLQNLLFYLLFSESKGIQKGKPREHLFCSAEEEDSGYLGEDTGVLAFNSHCLQLDGFMVSQVLEPHSPAPQVTLLANVLAVCQQYLGLSQSQEGPVEWNPFSGPLTGEEAALLASRYLFREEQQEVTYRSELAIYCHVQRQPHADRPLLACVSSRELLDTVLDNYCTLMDNESNRQKREYKFHASPQQWTQALFLRFMEALGIYQDTTINNKKIATYMGNDTKPNHVKYVKGMFIRYLKKKAKVHRRAFRTQLALEISRFDPSQYQHIIEII